MSETKTYTRSSCANAKSELKIRTYGLHPNKKELLLHDKDTDIFINISNYKETLAFANRHVPITWTSKNKPNQELETFNKENGIKDTQNNYKEK